jgi:predicted methyltransferase
MIKTIALFAICSIFTGCALTEDVSLKMQLTEKQRIAAEKMREASYKVCVRVQYENQQSTVQKPGEVVITTQGKIIRLYESNEYWYKGIMTAQGVIDSIFYNEKDGRILCGQKNWDQFSNTAAIQFREIGEPPKKTL